MSFSTLTLIVAAGLLGPMLAVSRRLRIPVLVGELFAGVLLGTSGLHALHANNVTFSFLAQIGFALIMFVAGSHVPLRDTRLRRSVATGTARAVAVGVVAIGLGIVLAHLFHTSHASVYALILASSSAAIVLPLLDSIGAQGPSVLDTVAQVAVADTACIVALPLAIEPDRAGRAALGALVVAAAAVATFVLLRAAERSGLRHHVHEVSERRLFAVELRVSLLVLFAVAALAVATHVSVMLAGFSLGLAVSAVGEPRRVAHQLFALTDGFFGPLFFVWIGASLDVRAFSSHPKFIVLGLTLGVAAVVAHALMAMTGQRVSLGVLAAAQLGVPVAAVALAGQRHLLESGESAAIVLGALITLAAATLAARALARTPPDTAEAVRVAA